MAQEENNSKDSNRGKTVLVTGANGYIGSAVCRAFVRAGWRTLGLVRKPEAAEELIVSEVIPVVGTFTDLSFLGQLYQQATAFDAIVSCTEQVPGYATHYAQVIRLVQALAEKSNGNGVRPLVLWSSGCKDYGTTDLHGAPGLAPHTEESPLNSPDVLRERTESSRDIFNYTETFDAALIRPTCVFGYTNGYYGAMFDWAEAEKARGHRSLTIPGDAKSIMHATHVDDCADAYVALAEHTDRSSVAGQVFNISGFRYETLDEVAAALAREYGFDGGAKLVPQRDAPLSFPEGLHFVFSFSQWVGSEKIQRVTGWRDRRMLFTENMHAYRLTYEAMKKRGHGNIDSVQKRIGGNFAAEKE